MRWGSPLWLLFFCLVYYCLTLFIRALVFSSATAQNGFLMLSRSSPRSARALHSRWNSVENTHALFNSTNKALPPATLETQQRRGRIALWPLCVCSSTTHLWRVQLQFKRGEPTFGRWKLETNRLLKIKLIIKKRELCNQVDTLFFYSRLKKKKEQPDASDVASAGGDRIDDAASLSTSDDDAKRIRNEKKNSWLDWHHGRIKRMLVSTRLSRHACRCKSLTSIAPMNQSGKILNDLLDANRGRRGARARASFRKKNSADQKMPTHWKRKKNQDETTGTNKEEPRIYLHSKEFWWLQHLGRSQRRHH